MSLDIGTEIVATFSVILTIVLTHVASAHSREKRLGSIEERLTRIETNVEWIQKSISEETQ